MGITRLPTPLGPTPLQDILISLRSWRKATPNRFLYIYVYVHTYMHICMHACMHAYTFFIYGVWGVEHECERMSTDGNWGISCSAVKKEKLPSTAAVKKRVLVNKSVQGGKSESRENCYMPVMLLLVLFYSYCYILFSFFFYYY